MKLSCLYDIGDRMSVDNDKDMPVTICAVNFRLATGNCLYITYQCSWIHNGAAHSEWIEEWRLTPWEE
jgi:hypothetical protein